MLAPNWNDKLEFSNQYIFHENLQQYECNYCNRYFKRKDNLTRHLLHSCKIKQEHEIIEKLIQTQKEKDKKLTEKTNELLIKEKQWKQERENLMSQIELLLTKIGNNCQIAGHVSVVGHIEICDNVIILAKSFVTKSLLKSAVYSGVLKVQEHNKTLKLIAKLNR